MHIALVCDRPEAVLVHKPSWVADGFRAAGHSVELVHDLAGVRAADGRCKLLLFDHKASGMNRAALAELAHSRLSLRERILPLPPGEGRGEGGGVAFGPQSIVARKACDRPHPNPLPKGEGTIRAQWWRDLIATEPGKPLAKQDHFRAFASVMCGMDIVFVKEQSLLDEYHRLGINAVWLDQACPTDMPACEYHEHPEWDVLVLGSTGYAQRRADARALADAGFRVLWTGMPSSDPVPPGVEWHPWVHPLKLPDVVSRCGVVLGVDWRSDLPGYTSDRTYLACGMGACYVARYTDCGSDFPPASYSPAAALAAWIYSSTNELIEIVSIAMSDVAERRRRGEWSRREVMRRHTYAHRAEEIIRVVGTLRVS